MQGMGRMHFERGDFAELVSAPDLDLSCGAPLPQIPDSHPVNAFFAHWRSLAGERGPPLRGQFDPATVSGLLPYIVIVEVDRSHRPYRYRNRLVGTRLVEMLGFDPTGLTIEDFVAPEFLEARRYAFNLACERGEPVFAERSVPLRERAFVKLYVGMFPFAIEQDGPVEQIFGVSAPIDMDG